MTKKQEATLNTKPHKKVAGAISKTKAKAMRRKATPVVVKTSMAATTTSTSKGRSGSNSNPHQVLLAQLMEQHLSNIGEHEEDQDNETKPSEGAPGLSFAAILSTLGMNDRNTGWRNAWKDLHQRGLIEQQLQQQQADNGSVGGFFTSPFGLTQKGIDEATTDELKEAMAAIAKNKPKTNAEHHERIKAKLMNERGEQIFDLLLESYTNSVDGGSDDNDAAQSRTELARKIGISDRGAYFSYALQQLKNLGYAEDVKDGNNRKKVRLTDKCFPFPIERKANNEGNDEKNASKPSK